MRAKDRLVKRDAIPRIVSGLKKSGKRIVFTNGCFDLLHVGHVRYLEEARSLGDFLIVGLNSDSSVRAIKGEGRPLIYGEERGEVLASLACVDLVVIFGEKDPLSLIKEINPDVLVKGGDWKPETVIGREEVEAHGGKIVIIPYVEGSSTTSIIEKIRKRKNSEK